MAFIKGTVPNLRGKLYLGARTAVHARLHGAAPDPVWCRLSVLQPTSRRIHHPVNAPLVTVLRVPSTVVPRPLESARNPAESASLNAIYSIAISRRCRMLPRAGIKLNDFNVVKAPDGEFQHRPAVFAFATLPTAPSGHLPATGGPGWNAMVSTARGKARTIAIKRAISRASRRPPAS